MNEYGKQVKKTMDTYMNNPDSIDKEISDIQNATHGVEVRGALAAGVKKSFDKSVEAETISENAQEQVNNIQSQVNQLVIEGDSSVEAAQARVDSEGNTYNTLKERLDDKETKFSSQLAQIPTKTQLGRVKIDGSTIKVDNEGIISTKNNKVPVFTPDGFEWTDHPLKNKIFTDGYGNFFVKDFDIEKYKPKGLVMYVDLQNGNDENDGKTLQTAKQTISGAYNAGAVIIKVAEGIYNRAQSFFGLTLTRSVAIESLPGHEVYLTHSWHANWQLYEAPVYVSNTTSIEFILDPSVLDENDCWSKYEQVSTIEDVSSTPGTYAIVEGQTYIHTFGSSPPDNTNVARFTSGDGLRFEANGTLFLKGLRIYGGNQAMYAGNTSPSDKMRVFAKDCEFKYSNNDTYNVVWVRGADLAIFENCSATDGQKDGFNYAHGNGVPTKAIEINCKGLRNGKEGHGDDQGSTQHNGGKIIRIGGLYHSNYGSNIADDGAGTQSWNLGDIAHTSRSGTNSQRANYYAYTDVDMWLEGCVGFDVGTNGSDIAGRGNIYIKNNNLLSPNKVSQDSNTIEY